MSFSPQRPQRPTLQRSTSLPNLLTSSHGTPWSTSPPSPSSRSDPTSQSHTRRRYTQPNDNNSTTSTSSSDSDIDADPSSHFLSAPMEYSYEVCWDEDDSDSESDDGFEWSAGITDFGLFHSERRQAQDAHEALPTHWNDMLSSQSSALQRAAQRAQHIPPGLSPPDLTPDASPNLCDDLEVDSIPIPSYLSASAPLAIQPRTRKSTDVYNYTSTSPRSTYGFYTPRRPARPGLSHARTMSGKLHSWRRPDIDIYPVGEDPAAELAAEREEARGS